jgi:hypothetical protein
VFARENLVHLVLFAKPIRCDAVYGTFGEDGSTVRKADEITLGRRVATLYGGKSIHGPNEGLKCLLHPFIMST